MSGGATAQAVGNVALPQRCRYCGSLTRHLLCLCPSLPPTTARYPGGDSGPEETRCGVCGERATSHGPSRYSVYGACPADRWERLVAESWGRPVVVGVVPVTRRRPPRWAILWAGVVLSTPVGTPHRMLMDLARDQHILDAARPHGHPAHRWTLA